MILRNFRRFSSMPPRGAGGNDNSASITLLGLAGLIGGVAYIYYDPDVLPDAVKKVLPIQEPKGHGMSVDEYEKWRAQQSGYPDALYQKKNVEERVQVTESSEDLAPDDLPVPRGDVSKEEMKESVQKLLVEARENEAAYLADIKKSKNPLTVEDRQMLQAFKDEKNRLKKELKFLKSSK